MLKNALLVTASIIVGAGGVMAKPDLSIGVNHAGEVGWR
jgi:hypothetical protein